MLLILAEPGRWKNETHGASHYVNVFMPTPGYSTQTSDERCENTREIRTKRKSRGAEFGRVSIGQEKKRQCRQVQVAGSQGLSRVPTAPWQDRTDMGLLKVAEPRLCTASPVGLITNSTGYLYGLPRLPCLCRCSISVWHGLGGLSIVVDPLFRLFEHLVQMFLRRFTQFA